METEITPSPWVRGSRGQFEDYVLSGEVLVAEVHSGNDADRLLIAAAPDLLAVARRTAFHPCMSGCAQMGIERIGLCLGCQARAAIAKAEGK